MATRTSVETKITAINNGGANTAAEVRDVLTELLNYTENLPPAPSVETFRISSQAPFFGDLDTQKIFVSIRGIKNEFATMTLMYKSVATDQSVSSRFIIPFNQTAGDFTLENFNMLAGQDGSNIIPILETGNYLIYSLPNINNNGGTAAITSSSNILYVALIRTFQDITNSLLIGVRNPNGDSEIATTISMHAQKFTENLNNTTGKNNIVRTASAAKGAKKATAESLTLEELFGL